MKLGMNAFGPQAGEESWASLKNDGGPHNVDRYYTYPVYRLVRSSGGIAVRGASVSYDGTEVGEAHVTPQPSKIDTESDRWSLPA